MFPYASSASHVSRCPSKDSWQAFPLCHYNSSKFLLAHHHHVPRARTERGSHHNAPKTRSTACQPTSLMYPHARSVFNVLCFTCALLGLCFSLQEPFKPIGGFPKWHWQTFNVTNIFQFQGLLVCFPLSSPLLFAPNRTSCFPHSSHFVRCGVFPQTQILHFPHSSHIIFSSKLTSCILPTAHMFSFKLTSLIFHIALILFSCNSHLVCPPKLTSYVFP